MSRINEIKAPIAGEMKQFEKHFRASMKTRVALLGIITNYILRRKGKQMRPMFVFLTAKLLGDINLSTYNAAALIELLHTATLIHDDVVDESYQRRGFFSINAIWKSKVAVLVGDYLLAKGLLLSVEHEEFDLLKITSEAVREMSEGELLQIQKSRKLNITEEEYFDVIRMKTAALISACTASGARSVNATEKEIAKCREFGLLVGVAFQIKDDLFDYQSISRTGKPSANDIKQKKFTLPLIHAMNRAPSGEKGGIKKLIRRNALNNKNVQKILEFVDRYGGIRYAEQKMQDYKSKAIAILKEFPENESRNALESLVDYTVNRKK